MKKRLRIIIVASIVLLFVAAGLFTRRNQYKNWFLYENFKDTPIRASIVLEKQQGIHLKYRYPVKAKKNGALYARYKKMAEKEEKVIFGGRLGEYKYYDMDAVIASSLELCEKELGMKAE